MLHRPRWKVVGESLIEWLIRICGVSAVIFIFAIFFFVFWEGKGILFGENRLGIWKFLTSGSGTRHPKAIPGMGPAP